MRIKIFPIVFATFMLTFCQPEPEADSEPIQQDNWQLVWSDEFDVDGLPTPDKWAYDVGYIANNEKQYYTESRPENARVENGHLIIEAKKESWEDFDYTSARLDTRPVPFDQRNLFDKTVHIQIQRFTAHQAGLATP
ncbi:MAG: hypothetical protein GVY08_10455 [Bacteroidetes bacterium]|jgi:hypothetical protein|nr:hypothetical protein [Bacteroidota bacterium]